MLDWVLIVFSIALGGAGGDGTRAVVQDSPPAEQPADTAGDVVIGDNVVIGDGVNLGAGMALAEDETATEPNGDLMAGMVPADEAQATSDPAAQFEAEDQTPTGKFTTATEIKPILGMTKANWVAVREYDGQDLLYVTHLWAWRCGLLQMRYSINGDDMQDWPLPPCHEGTNAPNAIIESDGLPYASFALGGVQSVTVELLFDDLSTDSASWSRPEILMP